MNAKILKSKESNFLSRYTIDLMKSILSDYFSNNYENFNINFELEKDSNYNSNSDEKYHVDCFENKSIYMTDNEINIYKFNGRNVLFSKNINNMDVLDFTLLPKMKFYQKNYEKLISLFSIFFEKVDVILLVNGRFNRNIGYNYSFDLNKIFKPTFKITNCGFRVIGRNPLIKDGLLGKHLLICNKVDLLSIDEDNLIQDVFRYYNRFIFKNISEVKLDCNKKRSELDSDLEIIKMLLF